MTQRFKLSRRQILPLTAGGVVLAGLPRGGASSAQAAVPSVTAADDITVNGSAGVTTTGAATIAVNNVIDVTNPTYGAVLDGIASVTGTISSGSANFSDSNANFQAGSVGKVFALVWGTSSTVHLVTTIKTVSSPTAIVLNANAGQSFSGTANYVYGTDDTAAWQVAITAAAGATHARAHIVGPAGISIIAGVLTNATGTYNAQIRLPNVPSAAPIGMEISGPYPQLVNDVLATAVPWDGLTLFSTLISTSGTQPACLGSPQSPGGAWNTSGVNLLLRNIRLRTMPNPAIDMLDASSLSACSGDQLYVDTFANINQITAVPTNVNVGIRTPKINCQIPWYFINTAVVGYKYGWVVGEAGYIDNSFVYACEYGVTLLPVNYPTHFGLFFAQWCPYNFYWTGAHPCNIESLKVEHWKAPVGGASWMATTYDLVDTGGYWNGKCNFLEVDAGIGLTGNLLVSGCVAATITPQPSNYSAPTFSDATLGDTLGAVTGAVVSIGGGGDQTIELTAVVTLTAITGTVLIQCQLYDVANSTLLSSTLTMIYSEALGSNTVTKTIAVSKRFRIRVAGPNMNTYQLYATANNGSGGAASGTSVILRGTAYSLGGSTLTCVGTA